MRSQIRNEVSIMFTKCQILLNGKSARFGTKEVCIFESKPSFSFSSSSFIFVFIFLFFVIERCLSLNDPTSIPIKHFRLP